MIFAKDDEKLVEKKKISKQVYDGSLLKVFCDDIVLPNGEKATREYIKHNGAVCIVPVLDNGNIVVERQFRYPMNRVITEIPAGKLDFAQENHLEAAKRELEEETGYRADFWTEMGPFYPSVAYTTECIWMYLATGLHKGERHLDEDEFLNVVDVPIDELIEEIMAGKIGDGKTVAAILKAEKVLRK